MGELTTSASSCDNSTAFTWVHPPAPYKPHFSSNPQAIQTTTHTYVPPTLAGHPPSTIAPVPGPSARLLQPGAVDDGSLQHHHCCCCCCHRMPVWLLHSWSRLTQHHPAQRVHHNRQHRKESTWRARLLALQQTLHMHPPVRKCTLNYATHPLRHTETPPQQPTQECLSYQCQRSISRHLVTHSTQQRLLRIPCLLLLLSCEVSAERCLPLCHCCWWSWC